MHSSCVVSTINLFNRVVEIIVFNYVSVCTSSQQFLYGNDMVNDAKKSWTYFNTYLDLHLFQ